jgi:hypothetical protein
LADGAGGFYLPDEESIYVIGLSFGPNEAFVYSQQVGHAVIDQRYDLTSLGAYPDCLGSEQVCKAIRALIVGDATLTGRQWAEQYGESDDYEYLLTFKPPPDLIKEGLSPPFVSPDLSFPFEKGLYFVEYLFDQGNWGAVDRVYSQLPTTTEQILHPEKYLEEEGQIEFTDRPLGEALDEGWRLLKSDTLGEWKTYLLLGHGIDEESRLSEEVAVEAAAGWGGDQYQVYYNENTQHVLLAAHWVWDNEVEATQFLEAFNTYQGTRFRGESVENARGTCVEANDQLSCTFIRNEDVLWVLVPDQTTLDQVLGVLTYFQ